MLIDLADTIHAASYIGAGCYLVALAGEDEIIAVERCPVDHIDDRFDARVFDFARRFPRRRIVLAVGFGYRLSWPDHDAACDLRWSPAQSAAAWRVR